MKISILIPTFNNLSYLKFFLNSLKENSLFEHEIIIHVNDGSDGTLDFVKKSNFKFTHSKENIGLCSSMNNAYKLSTSDFLLYAHDDMYFCKNWDKYLIDEINKQKNNFYYLSGTNVSTRFGLINYNCGDTLENFDENKFLKFCIDDNTPDLQSSHWAPHLIHRELWDKIGGFSEEFNPGDGSDPDFCMELWKKGVRIFKGLNDFKVYHFGSITTRKKKFLTLNRGDKIFLKKWGISINFFEKYYLKSGLNNKKELIFNEFKEPLTNPTKNINFYIELIKSKLQLLYLKILNF